MEKILYPLWARPGQDGDSVRDALLALAPALVDAGARGLRLSVADSNELPLLLSAEQYAEYVAAETDG